MVEIIAGGDVMKWPLVWQMSIWVAVAAVESICERTP